MDYGWALFDHLFEMRRRSYTRRPVTRRAPKRPPAAPATDPLAAFSAATRDWFAASFDAPTAAQALGWPAIASGAHTLICAPTGSGKTLAAFLWCLDRLMAEPVPDDPLRRLRVLYVSPLKALVHDVNRNLRAPLAGIGLAAGATGGVNVLAGKIAHRVFLGEVVDYLVDTGTGAEIRVRSKPELDFHVGQSVHVSVAPNKCVGLPS